MKRCRYVLLCLTLCLFACEKRKPEIRMPKDEIPLIKTGPSAGSPEGPAAKGKEN